MDSQRGGRLRRNRRRATLVGLNVVYAVLLVALSVSPRTPGGIELSDGTVHAVGYGVQTVLIFMLLAQSWPTAKALAASWLGTTAFGGLTESLQMLRPTRTADLMDIVADTSGALVACALIAAFHAARSARSVDE